MAHSTGELAESERQFQSALAKARAEPHSQLPAAMTANRLAATYTVLGQGERAKGLVTWLSELAHLDPDPALVLPAEVDSLCWRGVCRFLLGELFITPKAVECHLGNLYTSSARKGARSCAGAS